MGFPPTVRERALVAAARHCCICHRSKGINIEVHHIVHEASGGANDFGNAIPLCFDCHADAGHYNPEHPRGTKFSPRELRLHRDTWYEIVRTGDIAPADESAIHARYLICKSFDVIREIVSGDLVRIPVRQAHLVRTQPGNFLRDLVEEHPTDLRNDQEWGDHFKTAHEYLQQHPSVAVHQRSKSFGFPYFEALRQPPKEELLKRVSPSDAISRMLLQDDVPPEQIAYALAYTEVCGDDRFQELYRLRPLWAVYLAITNTSEVAVTLESLAHEVDSPHGLGYRALWARQKEGTELLALPAAGLAPNATAVIPLAALLGPLWPDRFEPVWIDSADLPTGQQQASLMVTSALLCRQRQ